MLIFVDLFLLLGPHHLYQGIGLLSKKNTRHIRPGIVSHDIMECLNLDDLPEINISINNLLFAIDRWPAR